MRPYVKLSHTRLVLHPSSDLFNGRAGLALIVGVLLACELILLLTDSVHSEGRYFRKKLRYHELRRQATFRVLKLLAGLLAASLSLLVGRPYGANRARFVGLPGAR